MSLSHLKLTVISYYHQASSQCLDFPCCLINSLLTVYFFESGTRSGAGILIGWCVSYISFNLYAPSRSRTQVVCPVQFPTVCLYRLDSHGVHLVCPLLCHSCKLVVGPRDLIRLRSDFLFFFFARTAS